MDVFQTSCEGWDVAGGGGELQCCLTESDTGRFETLEDFVSGG